MSEDHPLVLELDSLRTALEKYQHAAHSSSLQLQRAHLEATEASARSKSLEADNTRLKHEIAFLRANPDTTPASLQVSELSLALRRVSDKLSLTEDLLLQRTTRLAHALSEKARTHLEAKAALAQMDAARHREEESRSRERELGKRCKAAEEEARMADVVVMEYADLVRTLEGRKESGTESNGKTSSDQERHSEESTDSALQSPTHGTIEPYSQGRNDSLVKSLTENRFSLQRMLHEFNSETSNLQTEITRLHAELSSAQFNLDTERENSRLDRVKLAEALVEVDRCKTDDGAAGKMVSRYMRFSQSSIDMLQAALSTLKSRHAATLATLSSSSEALSHSLSLERKRASQLRDALDQLAEDISRETFGRRREIALRLRGVVREEKTVEALGAWLRRAEERRTKRKKPVPDENVVQSSHSFSCMPPKELEVALDHLIAPIPAVAADVVASPQGVVHMSSQELLDDMVQDARALLASLSLEDKVTSDAADDSPLARVILAEDMARSLLADLHKEMEKRMSLTRTMAKELFPLPSLPDGDVSQVGNSSGSPTSNVDDKTPPSEAASVTFPSIEQDVPSEATSLPITVHSSHDAIATRPETDAPPNEVDASEADACLPGLDERSTPPSEKLSEIQSALEPCSARDVPLVLETLLYVPHCVEQSTSNSHPLLNQLTKVSHRYDELQRAFRDCHLTLAKLKADIAPISLTSQMGIPVVENVIHRLDDFCEDARVELEIRIADEERLAKGFETLLGVPGALPTHEEKARIEHELKAFVNGTAPSVVKAYASCTTKLDDLQHDIVHVKRALHESIEAATEAQIEVLPKTPPAWSSWTPPFISRSPSRSSSPAPTFGTVITAPRQRRVSSTSLFSLSKASSESTVTIGDPYAHLDLRIPMPSQSPAINSPVQASPSRLRKTSSSSGMYLLGLGSRSGFFSKQEPIAEAEAPRSGLARESEGDSDTQNGQSDVE